jgi:hypothetical protein
MIKQLMIIIVMLGLGLSACQPVGTKSTALSPDITPTLTQVANTPSATATQILPTRLPTFTPRPPAPTLSPQEIAGSVLTDLSIDETHEYSPDGMCEWKRLMAYPVTEQASYQYNGQYFTYVTITCANQEPWVLVNEWKDWGLGYPLTSLLGWSSDGKFGYYDDAIIPDGCQPVGGFQRNVRRVELASGKITAFSISLMGGLTLSPDTTRAIYYDRDPDEVGVYDFTTGQELHIPFEVPSDLEGWSGGDFIWSPDGNNAIFLIKSGDACFPSGSSVHRVNLQGTPSQSGSSRVVTLLDRPDDLISIIEWNQPDHILITVDNVEWWLDPWTGKLTGMAAQP